MPRQRQPASGQSRAAPKLNGQLSWNETLDTLRAHIVQGDERGLPRYGVLSILARRVPFLLYDHPALAALCDTAFTDGFHVFIHTEFFKEVVAEDAQPDPSGRLKHSMVLVLLHELSHILLRHHGRWPANAPPLLWAIACDIAINVRLLRAYPRLRPGPVFDDAWGTKAAERQRYDALSEEQILQSLWEQPLADDRALVLTIQEATTGAQDAPPGREADTRGASQDVHRHLCSAEDLAAALDDNGLRHIRESLRLPDPNDHGAFEALRQMFERHLLNDLDKAKELRSSHPRGDAMAGTHLEQSATELIDERYRGRIDWRALLRELAIGSGLRYASCDELPSDIYYVPPEQMQLTAPVYLSSLLPAAPEGTILCILDTSMSVSIDLLGVFLSELDSLLEQEHVADSRVFLTSADTTFRGDMLELSRAALAELPRQMQLHGRGGTAISAVLQNAMNWVDTQQLFAPDDLKAIIYFTDLLDRAPRRESLPVALPQLLFITPPSAVVKPFRAQVEGFAEVAEIADGTVIDLWRS